MSLATGLFRKVSMLFNEENTQGTPGALVQRLICVTPAQCVRFLGSRPDTTDIITLSNDGKYEQMPRRDPEGLDDWPGINYRGLAFMRSENAFHALMNGDQGRSEKSFASYTIGRDDSYGAIAFALYDPDNLESCERVRGDSNPLLKPAMVYVVSVCSKRNAIRDTNLAMLAAPSLEQWCKDCGLIYIDHLLSETEKPHNPDKL